MDFIKKNAGIFLIIFSIIINSIGLYFIYQYFNLLSLMITSVMLFLGVLLTIVMIRLKKTSELPPHWVSLGMIFTFLSFLYVFKTTPDWTKINQIIPTISSAFITSIIGIGMSKIINFYLSVKENVSETKPDYESPETVLSDLRKYMKLLVQASNSNNDKINPVFESISSYLKTLNIAIDENNKLNNETFNRIDETFSIIAGKIGETINTGLNDVLTNLTSKLDGIVVNIGEDFNKNIEGLVNKLNKSTEDIIVSQNNANTSILEKQMNSLSSILSGISEYQVNVGTLINENKDLIDQQNSAHKNLLSLQSENQIEIIDNMKESINSLVENYYQLFDKNIESVSLVFDKLENLEKSSSERIETINNKFENLIQLQSVKEDILSDVLEQLKQQLIEINAIRTERQSDFHTIQDLRNTGWNDEVIAKIDKIINQTAA